MSWMARSRCETQVKAPEPDVQEYPQLAVKHRPPDPCGRPLNSNCGRLASNFRCALYCCPSTPSRVHRHATHRRHSQRQADSLEAVARARPSIGTTQQRCSKTCGARFRRGVGAVKCPASPDRLPADPCRWLGPAGTCKSARRSTKHTMGHVPNDAPCLLGVGLRLGHGEACAGGRTDQGMMPRSVLRTVRVGHPAIFPR